MRHCGTKRLETERLILRRFVLEDADAMYRNWASDVEVTKYLTWPAHDSVDVTAAVLQEWIAAYAGKDFYQWAIVPKDNEGQPIGSIGAESLDEDASAVHIGYCIGQNWWHKGITSEALKAVMGFFFDEAGFNRVEARHDTRNPHSGMVMQKCGMKYEGTTRSSDRNNQGICDVCRYAILKSER